MLTDSREHPDSCACAWCWCPGCGADCRGLAPEARRAHQCTAGNRATLTLGAIQ